MMVAVLEMAIDDYMKHAAATDRLRQGLFTEVERWIESTDRSWLYAFATICDHVGLDVDYMRRGLRAWRRRALEGAHGAVSDDAQASPMPPDAADEAPVPERRRAGNE